MVADHSNFDGLLNFYEDIDLDEPYKFPPSMFVGFSMTSDEFEWIDRYLWKLKMRIIDFSISAAAWQAELPKLDEVITDIMVASAESEKGCGGFMLYLLETKARHCKEIILIHIGREMGRS